MSKQDWFIHKNVWLTAAFLYYAVPLYKYAFAGETLNDVLKRDKKKRINWILADIRVKSIL